MTQEYEHRLLTTLALVCKGNYHGSIPLSTLIHIIAPDNPQEVREALCDLEHAGKVQGAKVNDEWEYILIGW